MVRSSDGFNGLISVLGWYGHGNVGDECYKRTFPLLHDCKFVFSDTRKDGDIYVLGGGNVVSTSFLEQLEKVSPKIAVSISVTNNDPIDGLKSFEKVYVRDLYSLDLLKNNNVNAIYAPDLAFLMTPCPKHGQEIIEKAFRDRDLYEKKVVVVFNGYLSSSQDWLAREQINFERVVYELAKVFDTTSASFIFVPFGTHPPADDRACNSWLASRCKFWKKNAVIYDELDPQSVLDIISASDAVISSRLHASIFSCVAGKPFIDLTHHDKNLHFLESIYKMNWSVPYWNLDSKKVVMLLDEFISSPPTKDLVELAANNRLGVKNNVYLLR